MNTATKIKEPEDLTFVEFNQWQQNAITYENLRKQSLQLKAGEKYSFQNGKWSISDYEGYAVISTVISNPGNEECYDKLSRIKEALKSKLNDESYYWLPEESYHQTIANTLSSERYYSNLKKPGIEKDFPGLIGNAFDSIPIPETYEPVLLKMIGFNVFGSCIALLGIFEDDYDYYRIMKFREHFYSNPTLNKIGIRLTRPFIGHITFAYLGRDLTSAAREKLAQTLSTINHNFESMNIVFKITLAELRYFNNLSNFQKEPDFPIFSFISK